MVMSVSNAAPASQPTGTPANGSLAGNLDTPKQIQDRFLKLLVTQLQNQDPLNPVENNEITQQMSQISMVQGISTLNTSMQALVATQSTQAAGLIDRDVLLSGNGLRLAAGQASAAAKLAGAATSVKVEVLGASGGVVRTLDLGARPAGELGFNWNGQDDAGNPLPDGPYTFRVVAKSGTANVATETYTKATVLSVSLSATGPLLDLSNGSQVALSAVTKIL